MSYNVGDKFIIEIDSKMTRKDVGFVYGIKGYKTLVFDDSGLRRLQPCKRDDETLTRAVSIAYKEGEDKASYRYEELVERLANDNAELHERINELEIELASANALVSIYEADRRNQKGVNE